MDPPTLQDLGQLKALYHERWESFMAKRRRGAGDGAKRFIHGGMDVAACRAENNRCKGLSRSAAVASLGLFGFERGAGVLWLAGLADNVKFSALAYCEMPEFRARALPNPYVET